VKTFAPGGEEGNLRFFYEMVNGLPSYRLKEKDGKRPLSYDDILKRLNGLAANKRKNEEGIAVKTFASGGEEEPDKKLFLWQFTSCITTISTCIQPTSFTKAKSWS